MNQIIDKSLANKRIISMVAAMTVCVIAGFGYAWSVLQTPIVKTLGLSEMDVSLTFTITIVLSTLAPLVFGKWISKRRTRQVILLGGMLMGFGLFLTAYVKSAFMLYITYGVIAGLGVGFVYPCIMAYAVKLFPDSQGIASGLMAAAYGSGAVIWAPVAIKIIQSTSLGGAFKILGVIFMLLIAFLSIFIMDIPENLMGEKFHENEGLEGIKGSYSVRNLRRGEMVRTAMFYVMIITFTFGTTSGLMIIGQASPILQQSVGLNETKAAVFVGIFALCNTLGRFLWGIISDRIGKFSVMLLLFIITAFSMAMIAILGSSPIIIIFMALTAASYGGFATIITPLTADVFGRKYVTENYGLMYMVFGLASLIGPRVAVFFKTLNQGSYINAFIVAMAMSILGCFFALYIKKAQAAKIK
ncbi:L-lactate MFS transporter [Alloiococcus sp. CFN-8]|uniref:L-lactate MFS transporter n=1 Tax=Alloiococcus sp. CFN-8 TaxID=3416081 RepID=UPI003CE69FD6